MEALNKRVDDIDARLRAVEQSNSSIATTLENFNTTVSNFLTSLESHEKKEDKRFEKFETELKVLARVAYIGIGGLIIIQFLIANDFISMGAK